MRIAVLTHNYPKVEKERKNAGVFISDFVTQLSKRINKVCVFSYLGHRRLSLLKWLNPLDIYYIFSYLRAGRRDVISFVKKNRVDFNLSMWSFPSGLFAYEAKIKLGIPYAVWCLGSDIYIYAKFPFLRTLIKKILKEADLCFGNSHNICQEVEKLSGQSCKFLPAVTEFVLRDNKTENLKNEKCNFLFIGRLEKVKGPDILIEAVYRLNREIDNFNVFFLGDGSLRDSLEKKRKVLGLQNKVFFMGNVSDKKKLINYFFRANALIIPSRSESLPLVFTEAVKTGLPVIASDVGDLPYYIEKHKLGFIFPKGDVKRLVIFLRQVIKEKKTFRKKYQVNFKNITKEFLLSTSVNKFLKEIKNYV